MALRRWAERVHGVKREKGRDGLVSTAPDYPRKRGAGVSPLRRRGESGKRRGAGSGKEELGLMGRCKARWLPEGRTVRRVRRVLRQCVGKFRRPPRHVDVRARGSVYPRHRLLPQRWAKFIRERSQHNCRHLLFRQDHDADRQMLGNDEQRATMRLEKVRARGPARRRGLYKIQPSPTTFTLTK